MNNSTSSRFASFELLRIIIPGIYFTFLVLSLIIAFELPYFLFESPFIISVFFIVTSLLAGLSFYAKETPKKRKAFQANQPSLFILNRSREIASAKPLTDDESRRLYFYILNHHMPLTVHDKVFFFGMIYHIMINIRRTSFWFGILGFIGLIIQIVVTQYMTPVSIAAVLLIWLVYFLNVRYNKADRKMQENYLDQIFWLEMNKDIVDNMILQRTQSSEPS
ncbi:MAG: hypothetical protein HYV29_00315 [Ignavibacteriales bacterium]|nr:hypothetical protein [Ignavibacteriales bacterium]